MKTIILNRSIKFLSVFVLMLSLLILARDVKSQETPSKSVAVYPTLGIGIGFFYPQDVNDYIAEEITSGYSMSVNTELYMYLEVKGGVTVRLKKVDFSALLEYDIAPKFVAVTGGENMTYSFSRFSPEVSMNYYIPVKSGRNAFFIGAGINYSFMKFEEFTAASPGFKIQCGYSMQFGKMNLQPYVAFRYTDATDTSVDVWGIMNDEMNLNYTGGQFGAIFSFHPRILYK